MQKDEIVLFDAYMDGVRVASEEMDRTSAPLRFDPGLEFDRIEIGPGVGSAFSLTLLEIDRYAVNPL